MTTSAKKRPLFIHLKYHHQDIPYAQQPNCRKGFALIATISTMVLLLTIALALLSLSTLSIRDSNQQRAEQEAQSNARLSLMLAIGKLQKHVGPDTRITASSSVIDDNLIQRHLTGVWNTRAFDPASPISLDKADKNSEFITWLSSGGDMTDLTSVDYIKTAPTNAELLISERITKNPDTEVSASRVSIKPKEGISTSGSFAYSILDEGVKARVNLGATSKGAQLADQTALLGGGQRPGVDRIGQIGAASDNTFSLDDPEELKLLSSMVTTKTAALGYNTPLGHFGEHYHDVSVSAKGIMCNVVKGGLKHDLNLIAETNITPSSLAGKTIYQNAFGLNIPSDPSWEHLINYLNLYRGKDTGGPYLSSSSGVPLLRATAPSDWSAGSKVVSGPSIPNTKTPSGPTLLPSIAKVQMIFSLTARDIYRYPKGANIPDNPEYVHNPWADFFRRPWEATGPSATVVDSKYDYLLHLIYTPVITLHNPYNVALEFNDLRIEFVDVPFSLQVYRNGIAQSKGLVPLNAMYGDGRSVGVSKRFGLTLSGKNADGEPDGSPLRLAPGEVKIFSPYIPPTRTWDEEITQPLWFADWANNNSEDGRTWLNLGVDTSKVRAVSGWRGDGIGFNLDSFAPGQYNATRFEKDNGHQYRRNQCIGLRKDDEIHVEFAPIPDPDRDTTRFTLEMTLAGANPDTSARTSVIEFNYESPDGLQKELLGAGGKIRYPEIGTVGTLEILDHSSTPIGSTSGSRPFALFSAYAKTTYGGFKGSRNDGSYTSKPWSFHNHSALTASQNIITEHPALHSHEINLVRLPGNTDEIIEIQPDTDRGQFITGHSTQRGTRLGTIHEIPLGPAQSFNTLNTALPAAGYYLPRYTRPIGNSFAHPLLPTNSITSTGPAGYLYADHSFLLNSVLYEDYYFSGIQSRSEVFSDGRSAADVTTDFLSGNTPLTDTRFSRYFVDGQNITEASETILGDDGYSSVAAYQLLDGAFNVNSTSVKAWKAVLSSMTGNGARILTVPEGAGESSIENLQAVIDPKGARFSRFRLPNGQPDSLNPKSYWQSPRDITENQLTSLAEEIVKQIRLRGPFLSMSDFVNRQLGPSGETTLAGTIQAAIDKTDINDNSDLSGFDISLADVTNHELTTPDTAIGPSAQGAPGYLTQADVLSVIGNAATVRSDTFTIRAYGDSRDASNKVLARAWCEAIVQRVPEYLDPTDTATTPSASITSPTNKSFGRRFKIISFRWLSPKEI